MTKYNKDALGTRMKAYEAIPKNTLMLGVPHIVRLDMRAGHSFCKRMKRPYDAIFALCMEHTAKYLADNVAGCEIAYTQSDEISLVLIDSFANGYNCFFDGGIEKICSITASMATLAFNKKFCALVDNMAGGADSIVSDFNVSADEIADRDVYFDKLFQATFDSRVFSVPNDAEAINYLIWRTQDATRNSVNMLAQSIFSHKKLQGKNIPTVKQMLEEVDASWDANVSNRNKHGVFYLSFAGVAESGKPRKMWKRATPAFDGESWYEDMSSLVLDSLVRTQCCQ